MNRRSLEKLRTDRRLAGRTGWLSKVELEKEAKSLPDASEKIAEVESDPEMDGVDAAAPEAGGSIAAELGRVPPPDTA